MTVYNAASMGPIPGTTPLNFGRHAVWHDPVAMAAKLDSMEEGDHALLNYEVPAHDATLREDFRRILDHLDGKKINFWLYACPGMLIGHNNATERQKTLDRGKWLLDEVAVAGNDIRGIVPDSYCWGPYNKPEWYRENSMVVSEMAAELVDSTTLEIAPAFQMRYRGGNELHQAHLCHIDDWRARLEVWRGLTPHAVWWDIWVSTADIAERFDLEKVTQGVLTTRDHITIPAHSLAVASGFTPRSDTSWRWSMTQASVAERVEMLVEMFGEGTNGPTD